MKKLLPLALLALFAACKKDSTSSTPSTPAPIDTTAGAQTFPLLVGSYWEYDIKEFDPTTGAQLSLRRETIRLQDSARYGTNVYYRVRPYLLRNIDAQTIGYYDSIAKKEVVVQVNGPANNTLVSSLSYNAGAGCKSGLKVYSNKDRVAVNGFNCYVINYETINCDGNVQNAGYIYMREGVGLVHAEIYRMNGMSKTLIAQQDLVSYRVAG